MSLRTAALRAARSTSSSRSKISLSQLSKRGYSTPSSRPTSSSWRQQIATSFAVGLVGTVAYRYLSDNKSQVQCDGAPLVEAIETHGYPWVPVDALEKDDPQNPMRIRMATWVKSLQDHIVKTMEEIESSVEPNSFSPFKENPKFLKDTWIRKEGGEGSSCVLSNGRVFEKAGINVSIVHGLLPPKAQKAMLPDHPSLPEPKETKPFFATGLSIVIHPRNPHIPTVHLNYRYFEIENKNDENQQPITWWFGGGSDLTPSYLDEKDCIHFHNELKKSCDKNDLNYYKEFKKQCDKYFFINHRNESRGIGGIFFDDLTISSPINQINQNENGKPKTQEDLFNFIKDASSSFLPAYIPIVYKHLNRTWTEEEKRWQQLRRGRYVEFNLVYDRGTKFGLHTPGARIESILMSLPETARWEYMTPVGAEGSNSPEEELQKVLKNPREWV
ncbi:uncharacterized protein I206_107417 [Kwoniella pini CBS 10737]|uniref:coproporphyrinogen oxidase n=1 Tax=Kwoniella pini CBS 10737 TaxID=1296096 RepID=A0A1B9HX88_9TREE|nr:coproporphyrinogen III oxidase [Kwoniella pini CBS 10737]OCF47880.1 coproporphyrinogen III oxidase [Kwoniella pini CBS 10737]